MTTPTPASTATPVPSTTTIHTPPAPAHRSVRDRVKGTSDHLFSKIRIYPVEITYRQHVLNWFVGAVVLIVMGFFLIPAALSNPDGSSRFSSQTFSGQAGLVIGISVIVLALYSGFWLVKRKAWHSIWLLTAITLVVLVVTPFWLRMMIWFSRLFFSATVAGVIAGVISLVLTIYIVIRLGATTSFDEELQDAQTAVSNKEAVLRRKQEEVDSAQAQIAPMQTTKENAETAERDANAAYDAAVENRKQKGKTRKKFVNKDKTVPAAQTKVDRAKLDYSSTRDQIDSLKKALKFTGSKDDLLPVTEAALNELVKFDAKYPSPLTPMQQNQRDLIERRHESLKELDDLLAQLITLDKTVKDSEKTLTKVTKALEKKSEVADHVAALKVEQEASDERDKKVKANKKAEDALNDHVEQVGELEEARNTLTTERDELQSTADTIESELGSNTRKFLLKIGIAALIAMFLIAGFAR